VILPQGEKLEILVILQRSVAGSYIHDSKLKRRVLTELIPVQMECHIPGRTGYTESSSIEEDSL